MAVVALALVAGCTAFGAGGGEPSEQTLTPVDISTETPAASAERSGSSVKAGADGNQSVDQRILARLDSVYGDRLSNTSYRVTSRLEFVINGSDVGLIALERRVAAEERTHVQGRTHVETFRVRGLPAPSNSSFAYVKFDNGSVRATRYTDEGDSEPRYRVTRDGLATRPDLTGRSRLEQLLLAYELERVRASPDGTVVLQSDRITIPSVLSTSVLSADVSTGNLTVRIGANGTVFARAMYNVTVGDNSTGYLVQTYRLDRVGDVAVQPPTWIPAAT